MRAGRYSGGYLGGRALARKGMADASESFTPSSEPTGRSTSIIPGRDTAALETKAAVSSNCHREMFSALIAKQAGCEAGHSRAGAPVGQVPVGSK
jgi:hypothetical protein